MKQKAQIMDKASMERVITRMSHEVLEKNKGTEDLLIIGIRSRGTLLAKKIAQNISYIEKTDVPVAEIDVTNYRDDIAQKDRAKVPTLNLDLNKKKIILVDDVLYTGRTTRAAMDALMDIGRPQLIQLAVLIDRGHRELPILANYVGKNVPTSHSEIIKVNFDETDKKAGVYIFEK